MKRRRRRRPSGGATASTHLRRRSAPVHERARVALLLRQDLDVVTVEDERGVALGHFVPELGEEHVRDQRLGVATVPVQRVRLHQQFAPPPSLRHVLEQLSKK